MKRIAIYYRVSTEKQDLASQETAVSSWLEALPPDRRLPAEAIRVYKDEGISGKTAARPGYQAMLEAAFRHDFDTIVVYRLDRLSRNATHAIKTLLQLDEVGVSFISVTQPVLNLGHENPFRRTMLAAFAEIAEIERDTIVARVRSGLEAARRRGVRLGPPTKVNRDKQVRALKLREDGRSYKEIARELELSVGAVHKLVKGAEIEPI